MRLSHLLFAVVSLLPLSAQAITLDKIGGHWVNTDITCKSDIRKGELCEFFITPKNKSMGGYNIVVNGKKIGATGLIAVSDEDVWTVSYDGEALIDLEYENDYLYDSDGEKYYRVSK